MDNVIYEILPQNLQRIFANLPLAKVYEIRLRSSAPPVAVVAGRSFYLGQNGLTTDARDATRVTKTDLETIIFKASDYSVYAINEQLKMGFITIRGGVRIGICGEIVHENGTVATIKNIQSLNIRVPHLVRGCSYQILPYVFTKENPYKTLIISPPGCGKTTMLRDIAWQICDKFQMPNVLILDERGEIAANYLGENQLDVGAFCDVISGGTKSYGFENGIRSMAPDVIITDELSTAGDIEMVRQAAKSGVCVFASVHAKNIDDVRTKPNFRTLVDDGIFDRYVVLTTRDTAGAVAGIFDRNLKPIC
jgi:stage III sporulation protein AA